MGAIPVKATLCVKNAGRALICAALENVFPTSNRIRLARGSIGAALSI